MDRLELVMLRLKSGLKQWQLAQELGISQTTLCQLEKGHREITPAIAASISEVLKECGVIE